MVHLDTYKTTIQDFLITSERNFTSQYSKANSMGIYCCPWSGWITTNYNLHKSLADTENNCPDFEFVEFDILDLPEWQEECEANAPAFKIGDKIIGFNHHMGDEKLNEIFFNFLLPEIQFLKMKINQKLLLQFLDSNWIKVL